MSSTFAFLDTSIVLRHILGERGSYPSLEKFDRLYASELMRVEALRAIDRLRIQGAWAEEEVALRVNLFAVTSAFISFVPIQTPILRRASEPFQTIVGTLDAIHIATALLLQEQLKKPVLFLTHDSRQGIAATATGLKTDGFEMGSSKLLKKIVLGQAVQKVPDARRPTNEARGVLAGTLRAS